MPRIYVFIFIFHYFCPFSEDDDDDTELSSAKVDSFCSFQCGKDVHSVDITSDQFKSLPPEIRHEILSELQDTRKQNSWARMHDMPEVRNTLIRMS